MPSELKTIPNDSLIIKKYNLPINSPYDFILPYKVHYIIETFARLGAAHTAMADVLKKTVQDSESYRNASGAEKSALIEKANITGVYLRNKLLSLQDKYECIGEVRGEGLLLGVELVQDRKSKLPHHKLGELTTKKCFELGLSMNIRRRPERGSVWRIAPPLTVTNEEIDMAISILDKALQDSLKVL